MCACVCSVASALRSKPRLAVFSKVRTDPKRCLVSKKCFIQSLPGGARSPPLMHELLPRGARSPRLCIMSIDSHLFLSLDMYCEASIFRGGGGRARSLLHALLNFDVAAAWSITLASEQVCILISFESSCVEQVTASLLCMHALTQSQFRCYIFIVLPHM